MAPGQILFVFVALLMGTAWGAVSLWVATSNRHLAGRMIALALPLGLLLRVPAYEPVLFHALQTIVVVIGVSARSRRSDEVQPIRFSLTSLLVATLVASLLFAVGAKTTIASSWTWLALCSGSISLGIATLFAAWPIGWWKQLFVFPVVLAVLAVPMGFCDALLLGFPEWDRGSASAMLLAGVGAGNATQATWLLWTGVLLGTYALLRVLVACWRLLAADREWKRWFGRVGVASLLTLLVAPLAWLYVCIPRPAPVREQVIGKNGFDVMTEAREQFRLLGPIDFPEQATNAELASAMERNTEAMSMLRDMASLSFQPPRDWNMFDVENDTTFLRYIGRAFVADSILARREGRLDDVIANVVALDRIAHNVQGSNMMMVLVSIAVEGQAHKMLAGVRADLNQIQALRVIEALAELDMNASRYQDVRAAEDAWAQRNWGWRKQLYDAFGMATGVHDMEGMYVASRGALSRSAVVRRLLLLDLAIRQYQRDHGSYPASLADLGLDATLLIDEFANDRDRVRYRHDHDGYQLYSVGPDHVDDGGVPIGDELWVGEGDLLLDSLFPREAVTVPVE